MNSYACENEEMNCYIEDTNNESKKVYCAVVNVQGSARSLCTSTPPRDISIE